MIITDYLDTTAERFPDKTAIVDGERSDSKWKNRPGEAEIDVLLRIEG